jgi:pyruvate-formate lyase-activating enzyme
MGRATAATNLDFTPIQIQDEPIPVVKRAQGVKFDLKILAQSLYGDLTTVTLNGAAVDANGTIWV